MAFTTHHYTLELTVAITVAEDDRDWEHRGIQEELARLFPKQQTKYPGASVIVTYNLPATSTSDQETIRAGKIEATITHRHLHR